MMTVNKKLEEYLMHRIQPGHYYPIWKGQSAKRTATEILDIVKEGEKLMTEELDNIFETVREQLPAVLDNGLFEDAIPVFCGNNHIKIDCPSGNFSLADENAMKTITETFSKIIGRQVNVELTQRKVMDNNIMYNNNGHLKGR